MKVLFALFSICISVYLSFLLWSKNTTEPLPVYQLIQDIKHPTLNDYRLIQSYLDTENSNLPFTIKNFKIIGNTPEENPQTSTVFVNASEYERENCVLVYASFNRNFPTGLKRLVERIQKSDFKGHVIYRLGGWPNSEGGSLILAHVPYAFKISFLKEAERLGYKRALYLDTAALPVSSLNDVFKMIEEKGYFVMGNTHMIGPYMNEKAAEALGISIEETFQIPSCSAGLIGIDFNNSKGKKIVDLWYKAAQDKEAFYSARTDQNALSVILYQLGISDFVSIEKMPHAEIGESVKPDSLFYLDRLSVH